MSTHLRAAVHTFIATFIASLAMWWSAAGAAGASAVHDVSSAQRFALSALLALAAALLVAVIRLATPYLPSYLRVWAARMDENNALAEIEAILDWHGAILNGHADQLDTQTAVLEAHADAMTQGYRSPVAARISLGSVPHINSVPMAPPPSHSL